VCKPEKNYEKINNKRGQQRYIARVRGGGTPSGGMMRLSKFVDLPNEMKDANFHLHVMNILRASWGSKNGFPFEMHMALTTLPCALFCCLTAHHMPAR
jgi:hypothetical protein